MVEKYNPKLFFPEKITETSGLPDQRFCFEHDSGRLELLIRITYRIIIGIVLRVYGIIAFICLFVQWFPILIPGQRNEGMSKSIPKLYRVMVLVYPIYKVLKKSV